MSSLASPTPARRRPLACSLLALAALAAGCGSTPQAPAQDDAAARAERGKYGAPWTERLSEPGDDSPGEVTDYGPFEVDGRRLVVRFHPVRHHWRTEHGNLMSLGAMHYPTGGSKVKLDAGDGSPWALLDAETGDALLPLDFWDIVAVPGRAVYVRKPADRLKLPGRTEGNAWKQLDVRTGELVATDVVWAGALEPAGIAGRVHHVDPLSDIVVLQRHAAPTAAGDARLTLELLPPPGADLAPSVIANVRGGGATLPAQFAGDFVAFNTLDDAGQRASHLLLADGTPWSVVPEWTHSYLAGWNPSDPKDGAEGEWNRRFLLTPAPGTADSDELYLVLDERGVFGAPEGVLGFRPFYSLIGLSGHVTMANRWLAKLEQPDERGRQWELFGPFLRPLDDGPRFVKDALFEGPYWAGVSSFRPSGIAQETHLGLELEPGKWAAWRLPRLPHGQGNRAPEATGGSLAALVRGLETQVAAQQTAHEERLAQLERERLQRLEDSWDWAVEQGQWDRAGQLAEQRGGDSYLVLALQAPRPALWVFDRARAAAAGDDQARLAERRAHFTALYAEEERYWAQVKREQEAQAAAFAARWAAPSGAYEGPLFPSSQTKPPTWEETLSSGARYRWKHERNYSQYNASMGWSPYGH